MALDGSDKSSTQRTRIARLHSVAPIAAYEQGRCLPFQHSRHNQRYRMCPIIRRKILGVHNVPFTKRRAFLNHEIVDNDDDDDICHMI